MSILKRILKREEGTTALEFAMVAPPLFLLILGIIDYGVMMATQGALEAAVTKTARHYKAISRNGNNGASSDNFQKIKQEIMLTLGGGIIRTDGNLRIYANHLGNSNNMQAAWGQANDGTGGYDNHQYNTACNKNAAGVKRSCSFFTGDVVQYQVKYDYYYTAPFLKQMVEKRELNASMVVQNEPDM